MAKITTFSSSFPGGAPVETFSGSDKTEKSGADVSTGSFFSRIRRESGADAGERRRHSSPAPEEWEQMRVKITALGKEVAATRSPEVIREYSNQKVIGSGHSRFFAGKRDSVYKAGARRNASAGGIENGRGYR